MLISTRGRYALRIMLELAQYDRGKYIPLPLIAERQEISEKYLESIISVLGKAGLVEGLRGKGGGYRLSRELKDYSVGEILRLSEGSLAPVACLDGEVNRCPRAEKCQTLPVWEKLDELINGYLDSISLADLLHQVKDEIFHIHDRGDKQRLFRLLRLQRLHGKPCPDADPIHPDMLPHRLHPGVDCLQLPGNHPRHQLFRAVFPGAVFRQVDSQHLPACWASCAGKAGSLGCAAVFAMDIEIDPAAALAVQDSRNACNLKLDFFHNGFLLF